MSEGGSSSSGGFWDDLFAALTGILALFLIVVTLGAAIFWLADKWTERPSAKREKHYREVNQELAHVLERVAATRAARKHEKESSGSEPRTLDNRELESLPLFGLDWIMRRYDDYKETLGVDQWGNPATPEEIAKLRQRRSADKEWRRQASRFLLDSLMEIRRQSDRPFHVLPEALHPDVFQHVGYNRAMAEEGFSDYRQLLGVDKFGEPLASNGQPNAAEASDSSDEERDRLRQDLEERKMEASWLMEDYMSHYVMMRTLPTRPSDQELAFPVEAARREDDVQRMMKRFMQGGYEKVMQKWGYPDYKELLGVDAWGRNASREQSLDTGADLESSQDGSVDGPATGHAR